MKFLAKALSNALPGGPIVVDLLVDVLPEVANNAWEWWSKNRNANERKADVEAIVQAGGDKVKEGVAEFILEFAADKPQNVQDLISLVLTQVPAMARKSLRRPADPSGRTVSADREPKDATDLLAFLPPKLPRFKPGDRPLPSVDWELVELLGVGGFGEVWKARNPHMSSKPPAALKFCLDTAAAKVLRNEAAILNRVMTEGKHPGIVELHQTYLGAETPCLEYELVEGGDLAGLISEWHRSRSEFKSEQIAAVIYQLASIVGSSHRLSPPIVHRDLKPANILVRNSTDHKLLLKVADFGIGGAAMNQAVRETTLGASPGRFLASAVQGAYTPLYASPQQTRGERADPRDDVFSIGVIWYQMLTGDLTCGRPGGSRWRIKLAERGVASELCDLLETCFEDNPDDRPTDALALAERLENILSRMALAFLNRGNAHLEAGEWDQAIADFTEAIRLNSKDANAYNKRGHAFDKKGEYDNAIADFTEVIQLNPQNADSYCNRGFAQFEKGNWSKAIDDYNEAIRLDPENADAYCNLGIVYFEKRDCKRAIANYNVAIGYNSNHAKAYYQLAVACEKLGKTGRAINHYTEAIRLDPNYADPYLDRAIVYENKEQYGRAISDYSIFIRLKPNYAEGYWWRGDVFRQIGEYDSAYSDYKEAIRLDPEDKDRKAKCVGAYCELGDKFDKRELYEDAINFFTMAIQLDPENKEAKKKYAEAAYFLNPLDNETKLKYAAACRSRGDDFHDEDAITFYTKAIEFNPADKDTKVKCAAVYCSLGDDLFQKGKYSEAIENYANAIQLNPQDEKIRAQCANSYRKRGDASFQEGKYDKAIADFIEAIRLNPDDAITYSNRAKAHRELGDETNALNDEQMAQALTHTN